jgi:hypothetical protein
LRELFFFAGSPSPTLSVILGLDPRIHATPAAVDARLKAEHDKGEVAGFNEDYALPEPDSLKNRLPDP